MKQPGDRIAARKSRGKIIDAATALFAKTTFDKVSVEEIARLAGVAHGLVFHYFGSKARLYEAVSQAAADRLSEIHAEGARQGDNPAARLAAFLEAHMAAIEERSADYVFHSRGGGSPAIQAIWESSRRQAIGLVLGLFGVHTPSEALVVATRAWLGFYDELVLEWIQGRQVPRAGVITASLGLFPAVMKQARMLGADDAPALPDDAWNR